MTVHKAVYQLLENALCHVFLELAPLSDIVEQVTARSDLDDKQNVFLRFKVFEEPDDILVPGLLQDDHFLQHLASLRIFSEVLLVNAFDCYHLMSQIMQSKVDFSEGTLAQDFTDSVEVYRGHRHLPIALEPQLNIPANFFYDFLFSRKGRVLLD